MKIIDNIKLFLRRSCADLSKQQESVCLNAVDIFLNEYGFLKSLVNNSPVDKKGAPIPWYTYPAIEFISQFDLRDKIVFEYGAGNSSLFWATRAKKVVSVENNSEWYKHITKLAPPNLEMLFCTDEVNYVSSIENYFCKFDVIAIDGAFRLKATKKALVKLAEGGMIIFDNSDRAVGLEEYSLATSCLRDSGYTQVDMSGFGPVNGYAWTTSFFFKQKFSFETRDLIQPHTPVGGNVITPVGTVQA